VIANHRRTKRNQPSGAIAAENNCPEVTEVVYRSAEARKCDTEPTRATQKKTGTAQSLRKASVVDAGGQRADTGHPRADADPSWVTQSQRGVEKG